MQSSSVSLNLRLIFLHLAMLGFWPGLWSGISEAKDLNTDAYYDRTTGNLFVALVNEQIGAFSLETQNPILNFESVITTTPLGSPSIANESQLSWFDPAGTGLPTGYFGIGPVFDAGLDFTTLPSANGTRSRVTLGGVDLGLAVLNYTVIGSGIPTQSVAITVIPEPSTGMLLTLIAARLWMRRQRLSFTDKGGANPHKWR